MKKMVKGIAVAMSLVMMLTLCVNTCDASAAAKVKLSKKTLKLIIGKQKKLVLKNAKGKVKWTSSKKSVATVSSKGVVKAKSRGTATITAKNKGKKYKCKVTADYPDGKVLNIYVWNDEVPERIKEFYPKYKNGMIGDVYVNFVSKSTDETSTGNKYTDNLKKALKKQSSAPANDKVDIFMGEADYMDQIMSAADDYAIPVSELGITDEDTSEMFDFTKRMVTDSTGVLRGLSWQACSSGMIYRRSYAKQIFGTDDPAAIQEKVSDMDKFRAACEEIKSKSDGDICMASTSEDLCRMFDDSVIEGLADSGYIKDPGAGQWSPEWSNGMSFDGKIFAYFGPKWFVDIIMAGSSGAEPGENFGEFTHVDGMDSYGDWAIIPGPKPFNWGGTWYFAAKGGDNTDIVADILKTLTCDQDVMTQTALVTEDCVNSKKALDNVSAQGLTSKMLGGQDWGAAFKNISMLI